MPNCAEFLTLNSAVSLLGCSLAFVLIYDDVDNVQKWFKGSMAKQKLIFKIR